MDGEGRICTGREKIDVLGIYQELSQVPLDFLYFHETKLQLLYLKPPHLMISKWKG